MRTMINLDERYHSYLEGIKNFRLDGVEEKVKSYGWDCDGNNIVGYYVTTENFLNHFNIQKLSDLPTIDELGSAGLIDTSTIDKSIFGTGKFFKEQSISKKQNIYEEIDEAIKKAPEEEK